MTALLATAMVITGAAGCGSDELDRTEFVGLTTQGDGGLTREVANCVFDQIAKDDVTLSELTDKGARSDDLSDTVNDKLETYVAECILKSNEADEPDRTTTTR